MRNKRMSFKRLLFTFMVMVCLCVPSSIVFAQTDKEMTQEADKGVPEVRFTGDVNGHEEFKFVPVARTTQEPTSKWSWSDGKYYVDGSSRRYLYRGKANALAESILLAMGRNINKLHCKIQTGRTGSHLFSLKTA